MKIEFDNIPDLKAFIQAAKNLETVVSDAVALGRHLGSEYGNDPQIIKALDDLRISSQGSITKDSAKTIKFD